MRSLVHQNKGILLTPSRFLPAILYCLAQSVRPKRYKSKYYTIIILRYHLMRHCCRPRSLPMRSSTIAQNISLSLSRFAYFRFSSSMFAISFACSIVNSFTILVSFSSSSFVQGPYINALAKHLKQSVIAYLVCECHYCSGGSSIDHGSQTPSVQPSCSLAPTEDPVLRQL